MKLINRTILITGGTSGIGRALAKQLQKDNAVIVTGVREASVAKAEEAGFTVYPLDLTSKESIEALALQLEKSHPDLDVLINNAGIQHNYDFLQASDTYHHISQEIAVNLTGTIYLTQLLLALLGTKNSSIINVTSALGAVPKSDGLIYSATKAGLRNFTRGLRKIVGPQPIRVYELVPPVTDTAMTAGRSETKMPAEELARLALKQLAANKRVLAPSKIKFFLWLDRVLPRATDKIIQ